MDHGLVDAIEDDHDKRSKNLHMTEKGLFVIGMIHSLLPSVDKIVNELGMHSKRSLLKHLQSYEQAMEINPLHRVIINDALKKLTLSFTSFRPVYADAYAHGNTAWLEKYFVVEPFDKEVLSNLDKYILNPGGQIYIALLGNIPVGGCSLINLENGEFELSKMYVLEALQGKGIGKQLLSYVLEQAKLEQKKLIIYSSRRLKPAIHLYKSLGFEETNFNDFDKSRYQRCDIKLKQAT
jgi:GNAT superfamily N-acetyltransferase